MVLKFLSENEIPIRLGRGLIRIGIGFIFENLAILFNIRRWNMILEGTVKTRDREEDESVNNEKSFSIVSGSIQDSSEAGGQLDLQ